MSRGSERQLAVAAFAILKPRGFHAAKAQCHAICVNRKNVADECSTDPEPGVDSGQATVRNVRSKCRCSCVLQFTFRRAVSCVLHRPTSQVIHCTVLSLCFSFCLLREQYVLNRLWSLKIPTREKRGTWLRTDAEAKKLFERLDISSFSHGSTVPLQRPPADGGRLDSHPRPLAVYAQLMQSNLRGTNERTL